MKLRVARHTTQLTPLISFYTTILDLEVIGDFKNHGGYNGVFIGGRNTGWHLEFTESTEAPSNKSDDDDLLVFYVSPEEYKVITERIAANNIETVKPKNPYWEENGVTVVDPDGFRVVIAIAK
ncbi:VOC family protein [Mucilaginibacter calamicampi]|uniref:VOC family protein n=1 Tax=Mucilaginibacter calamicampi TaxID=1302352 RepID=A0ABW2YRW7_9SPHI